MSVSMDNGVMKIRSDYFDEVYGDHDKFAFEMRRSLRGVKFDTMIGTGLSGTIAVVSLAPRLNKSFAIVRKPGVSSHSYLTIDGDIGRRWIFVDDFKASGSTRMRVMNAVQEMCSGRDWETTYVGDLYYSNTFSVEERFWPDGIRPY